MRVKRTPTINQVFFEGLYLDRIGFDNNNPSMIVKIKTNSPVAVYKRISFSKSLASIFVRTSIIEIPDRAEVTIPNNHPDVLAKSRASPEKMVKSGNKS